MNTDKPQSPEQEGKEWTAKMVAELSDNEVAALLNNETRRAEHYKSSPAQPEQSAREAQLKIAIKMANERYGNIDIVENNIHESDYNIRMQRNRTAYVTGIMDQWRASINTGKEEENWKEKAEMYRKGFLIEESIVQEQGEKMQELELELAAIKANTGKWTEEEVALNLMEAVYETENGGAGGYGHICFDDGNLDDDSIDFCLKEAFEKKAENHLGEETRIASIAALLYFKGMTEEQREDVYRKKWD